MRRLMPEKRVMRERTTAAQMIRIYCRGRHGMRSDQLCADCSRLLTYTHERIDRCPQGAEKVTCRKCPIHCYRADMRAKIRAVMRYAGPRMIMYHPMAALRHLLGELLSGWR